jgi:hypothetical protein
MPTMGYALKSCVLHGGSSQRFGYYRSAAWEDPFEILVSNDDCAPPQLVNDEETGPVAYGKLFPAHSWRRSWILTYLKVPDQLVQDS